MIQTDIVRNQVIRLAEYESHPRNYNRHSPEQIKRIAGSLRKFGQVRSVVVWRNYFLAGHGVREAALALGWDTLRADVLPDDYLEERALAYVVADNEIARQSDPDQAALAAILQEVGRVDAELVAAAGFSAGELEQLLRRVGIAAGGDTEPQVDRAEELWVKWQTEPGQLWSCGEHRLICGDCTDKATVERVMGGERADMVFTDPPYNVASESRNYAADKSKAMNNLKNAEWDQNFDIMTLFPALEMVMAKDCAVYVCTSHWLVQRIWEWMWIWSDFCSYNVWCKPNPMPSLSMRHWTWATELIAYAVRGKHVSNFPVGEHALNWWNIPKGKDTDHPTEKALEVVMRPISFSSNPGAIVFDGFAGSGTTGIACHNLGRKARMIEISPGYCGVILERMQTHTNQQPILVEAF